MTVAPVVMVFALALIIILGLATFCFGLAWHRAEAEISMLRRHGVGQPDTIPSGRVRP
jgi:hypothetical protein